MRVGLIPLDERPVNTRYPAMIAAIAGAEVVQPPLALLSDRRTPADSAALVRWLEDQTLDKLIVSLETLVYGGLIASRISDTPPLSEALDSLRVLKQAQPTLEIYGFNVITRISFSNDNFEEPLYWKDYGTLLYAYSQYFDRAQQGEDTRTELAEHAAQIPPDILHDFIRRRLRNHITNLAALHMAAEGVFDLLVISSDDTSEYGFGSREKGWLTEWAQRLALDHLLLYPGADEVGTVLLTRALKAGPPPRFYLHYAIPGDEALTAPFEDGPVRLTLERQVRAIGGVIVADAAHADLIVAVNTPSRQYQEKWPPYGDAAEAEYAHRLPLLTPFAERIRAWLPRPVIVVDVAYPNGADPVLVDLLCEHVDLPQLAAYGAWNTAGNTIGVALAQGLAAAQVSADNPERARFLLHRFLEDWGYQYHVREAARERFGQVTPANQADVIAVIEAGLQAQLERLPGFAGRWRVGGVRLPWGRFFEVDFDLERL